jgi:hypothetical protein
MRKAVVAVTVVGVLLLVLRRSSGEQVMLPLLFLQMFAASTGFAVPARRGHYDLLMTGGAGRAQIAATHLLFSIAPGVCAWVVLGLVELVVTGERPRAFAGGSVAAMLLVSTLAWAVTVPLPRLSGGIIWLLSIVIVLAGTDAWRNRAFTSGDANRSMSGVLMYALCPFVLVGQPLPAAAGWAVVPGAILSAIAVGSACWWIAAMDVPLEASH